ncbi:hypothetical protein [Acinetobacter sp. MB5]|uniref:hypothetical protein n=1 Tax=Acinetobacter sp. MB5 TaxID=2069438 RepID=UPI000DD0BE5D|nr:hypothetical protein [Acinetobacter sp. MB5]
MSKPTCPYCGSHRIHIPQSPSTGITSSYTAPQVLQNIVSYALMGAATAQKFRASRQPWVILAGVAVGGVMGCVVTYLNQQNNHTHPIYHCQECQQQFPATMQPLWS